MRVVPEPKLGLAYARKRGVYRGHPEAHRICDDDNWLAADYLEVAADVLSDPEVGAVSGQAPSQCWREDGQASLQCIRMARALLSAFKRYRRAT